MRAVSNTKVLAAALLVAVVACNAIKRMPDHPETDDAERPTPAVPLPAPGGLDLPEAHMRVYLTGYSFWDNTPPQSAVIAHPVLHDRAGGSGTFDDPVTLAVGHKIENGASVPNYAPGTRFYLPRLRKYAIVEDLCGDGDAPQDGPCYIGYRGHPWLDLYIGGASHNAGQSESCGRRITGLQAAIMHPRPHYPTVAGEVLATNCGTSPASAR